MEGIDSERGIAWRVADSLSLRDFLGCGVAEQTADHSTVSRTRRLYALETHKAVFRWMLQVDGTRLEANAAMRSIRRRDDGRKYEEYLKELAQAEGIENPTREQLALLDRKRKKKASNKEWMSPTDQDARIARMKDGRTHLAHKAEPAVDLASGAIVAVTLQAANQGDTTTVRETLKEAQAHAQLVNDRGVEELVADKGYQNGATLIAMHQESVRTYIHSGAGARAAAVAGAGDGTTAGVCQPAAGAGSAREAIAEAEVGIDGAEFRSHVRTKYGMGKPRSLGRGFDPLLADQIAFVALYLAWADGDSEFEQSAA